MAEAKEVFCRECRGTVKLNGFRLPYGWYQVTVGVPEYMESGPGRGYLWLGMFCSAKCLGDAIPTIREQEELARQAYEPEVPS